MSTWKCVECEHVREGGSAHCPMCGSTSAVNASALPPSERRTSPRPAPSAQREDVAGDSALNYLSEISRLLTSSVEQQKRLVAAQERAADNTDRIKWAVWALFICLVVLPTLGWILWTLSS